MSLATWKKEFYRIRADKVSKKNALRHSLKKWIGLRPPNRKKHGVILVDTRLVEKKNRDIEFEFGSDTCALCHHFDSYCENCPLMKIGFSGCGEENSPYRELIIRGAATPMIKALQEAVNESKKK